MTAITSPTEVSVTDTITGGLSGTTKKRKVVFIRATSEGTSDTLDLTALVGPEVADVENLIANRDNINPGTAAVTWSGTGLTTLGGPGAYEIEITVTVS